MNNLIGRALLGVFALGVGFVGVSLGQSFGGTWYSGSTTISVAEKDGFVDVMGKDNFAMFNCSGIIEKGADGAWVDCYGGGMNFVDNYRFAYKSRMKLTEKGAALDEAWELRYSGTGGAVKKITDVALYRRKKPDAK